MCVEVLGRFGNEIPVTPKHRHRGLGASLLRNRSSLRRRRLPGRDDAGQTSKHPRSRGTAAGPAIVPPPSAAPLRTPSYTLLEPPTPTLTPPPSSSRSPPPPARSSSSTRRCLPLRRRSTPSLPPPAAPPAHVANEGGRADRAAHRLPLPPRPVAACNVRAVAAMRGFGKCASVHRDGHDRLWRWSAHVCGAPCPHVQLP